MKYILLISVLLALFSFPAFALEPDDYIDQGFVGMDEAFDPLSVPPVINIRIRNKAAAAKTGYSNCYSAYEKEYYAEARKLCFKAAEDGSYKAMHMMGYLNEHGLGEPQNSRMASGWYKLGEDHGSVSCAYNLGILYYEGKGVTKSYAKALSQFRKAAAKGHAKANTYIGYQYNNGEGVPRDYFEAWRWYLKGAESGDVYGQRNVGLLYEGGRGVAKDLPRAFMFFSLAASNGYSDAKVDLERIKAVMSSTEISKGDRLLREWKAKHQK